MRASQWIKLLLAGASWIASQRVVLSEAAFNPLYAAQGELVFESIRDQQKVVFRQVFRFNVAEDETHKWRLDLDTEYPDPKLPIKSLEKVAYDGKDVYSVVYSPQRTVRTATGQTQLVPNEPIASNQFPARVCSGPYPIDHSSAIGLIWLAFLSGNHLDQSIQKVRFPNLLTTYARRDPMAWICDLDYALAQSEKRPLLTWGRFSVNKSYISKSTLAYPQMDEPETPSDYTRVQKQIAQYSALSGDLLTRASYYLEETNAINGVLIPQRFRCEVQSVPDYPTITGRFEGIVTNTTPAPRDTKLMPSLLGKIHVQDRRVRYKNRSSFRREVYYDLGSSGWITDTNEPAIMTALAAKPARRVIPVIMNSTLHKTVVALFVVVLGIAPLYLFLRKRRPLNANWP